MIKTPFNDQDMEDHSMDDCLLWASEATARKTRIIDVVYNACNNELVRCLNKFLPQYLPGPDWKI